MARVLIMPFALSDLEMTDMKTCSKCGGEPKPASQFSKRASSRDGLNSRCKVCDSAYQAARYAANPEKAKAAAAAWYAANPEKAKANGAKYRAANPEKVKAGVAKWIAANPEKRKATNTAWVSANTEKVKASSAKWRAANPEKKKAHNSKWSRANPEACRIYNRNRRARKREAGGKLSSGLSDKLFALQRGKCACGCLQPLGDDFHMDHVMPLALGGSNTDDNMQLLRSICNRQKHAKHPVEFMQSRGFLL